MARKIVKGKLTKKRSIDETNQSNGTCLTCHGSKQFCCLERLGVYMQQLKQQPHAGLTALNKTILVVEDDESIGSMLVDVLSLETSCQILLVTDAFQAMRVMRNVKPCLFITDYHLPQMDGIQLYDHFCTTKELMHIPTIIMSAQMPEDEVEKRHLVGLNKPFELDDLLDTVANLLEK